MLKNLCIPGINPTWIWCVIHLMYCWILYANILLRIFCVSAYQEHWPVILFFVCYLCLVWYRDGGGFKEWVWECSFLCNFLQYRCFKRIGVNPSLNVLYNSPVKLSGHGHWLLEVFKSQFQFQYLWLISSYFLFHILFHFILSISSWFSLGRLYSSKILSMSSRLSILLVYNCLYSVMIFCISVLSVVASFLKIVLI